MKQELRKKYKAIRNKLSADEVQINSHAIAQQLFNLPIWQQAQTIMVYLAFQNEVQTDLILKQGWAEKKIMAIPICHPQDHTMHLARLDNLEQLTTNRYGIAELPTERQELILPTQVDLCLIPGIAFDLQGNRLGFGAGYYDRYLPQLREGILKIALAHHCQISADTLPTDSHDLPMDYILTEKQIYLL